MADNAGTMRALPRTLVALACALGLSGVGGPAAATRHTPPAGVPAPRGPGRIIPVLADGTLREPSVDRAETVDEPDTVAAHHVAWDVTLTGAATDHIGTIDKQGQEAGAA